jgi:hypothetical protein
VPSTDRQVYPDPPVADSACIEQLLAEWERARQGELEAQASWEVREGGTWQWEADALHLQGSRSEWAALQWRRYESSTMRSMRNFMIGVTVSGKAEVAGLSFGPYKDFLTPLNPNHEPQRLQLEIDADAGCWTFRVDGQLAQRQWWDSAVHSVEDLLSGTLEFKARHPDRVLFQDLTICTFPASCRLSVVVTCYRFVQRLRVTLRNWCHQDLAPGTLEVLVVNPQSPDGTHEHLAAVAHSYPHVRVREVPVDARLATNKGAMINRAVAQSRGEWIWLTDADCLFGPTAARQVLEHIGDHPSGLFYGQRRHLTATETAALLAGRIDGLRDFADLAGRPEPKGPENAPWGYTQILPRALLARLRYHEHINHFAHTDDLLIQDCKRLRIPLAQIEGLYCLHLDHPFAWYGTNSFL